MNSVSALPHLIQQLTGWAQPRFFALLASTPLALKVYEFVKHHFTLLQYTAVFAFGAKELAYDRVQAYTAPKPAKIDGDAPHEFHLIHGTLFTLSGVVGIVAAIGHSVLLKEIALGLFNCGNIVALLYYGEVLSHSKDPVERKSAALGLISNLGYILATAAFLMSMSEVIALLLGVMALMFGGVKILYDAHHMVFGRK